MYEQPDDCGRIILCAKCLDELHRSKEMKSEWLFICVEQVMTEQTVLRDEETECLKKLEKRGYIVTADPMNSMQGLHLYARGHVREQNTHYFCTKWTQHLS